MWFDSQKRQFFDGVVQQLHDSGALQPFDTPKGKTIRGGSSYNFFTGRGGSTPDLPGLVRHIGDVPYEGSTSGHLEYGQAIEHADMALKSTSIRKAIHAYMPDDRFAEYLDHFIAHQKEGRSPKALKRTLSNALPEQMSKAGASGHHYVARELSGDSTQGLREALAQSGSLSHRSHYPELMTTLTLYHAAHQAYLGDLRAAVKRSRVLSHEEKQIATKTLDSHGFKQFDNFLIYATLLPLVIHYYEDGLIREQSHGQPLDSPFTFMDNRALEDIWKAPVDHERMKQAIGQAWDTLYEKELLIGHYDHRGGHPRDNAASSKQLRCPAHAHLATARKDRILEQLYDTVCAAPQMYAASMTSKALGPDKAAR